MHIEGHREWKAIGFADIQTGSENPVGTTVLENATRGSVGDDIAIQWNIKLAELIRWTRDKYGSDTQLFKPTDIHISYGLCRRLIESHSLVPEASKHRDLIRKICSDHFAELLSTTRAYVYNSSLPHFVYDVVLVYKVEGSNDGNFDWQFSRTMREFEFLDRAVNEERDALIVHSARGMNMASLFQNLLNHVFRAPTSALLENAEFLDFIRPDPHRFYIENESALCNL